MASLAGNRTQEAALVEEKRSKQLLETQQEVDQLKSDAAEVELLRRQTEGMGEGEGNASKKKLMSQRS